MCSIDEKEYLILCDESDRKGKYYSNFYGGVRIGASQLLGVEQRLKKARAAAGLTGEVKWGKVDQNSVEMYEIMMTAFFNEMERGSLVARIMFTKNAFVPVGLTQEHRNDGYYILYYEFLKHCFGLRYMPPHSIGPRFRIYLDELGDTEEQIAKFKGFLAGLSSESHIRKTGMRLDMRDITHVRSHDHLLMQCIDVVLGSITFRLNNKHKEKVAGSRFRGKRTIAKERLYKFINNEICRVTKKNFNIGISTGFDNFPGDLWSAPYRHWLFEPKNRNYDPSQTKP